MVDDPGDGVFSAGASATLATRPLDVRTGPTCSLGHFHDATGSRSRLVFGVHHAVADARGTLMMLDDLRAFYAALQRGDEPVVDVDWSPRTLGALLDAGRERLDTRARRAGTSANGGRPCPGPRTATRPIVSLRSGAIRTTGMPIRLNDALVGAVEAAPARVDGASTTWC